jgi:predicted metal-dependent enzyme (double-stranded beta helix superfamily)
MILWEAAMHAHERRQRVAALVADAKAILTARSLSRDAVGAIAAKLEALAALKHLWSEAEFRSPTAAEREQWYLVSEEPDRTFALYLNAMCRGQHVPPHNHTTWACIAAIEGCELNTLYERQDDGSEPGRASLRERTQVRVEPGRTIALMPDDIHAVANLDAPVIRHIHFYGRAVEVLDQRLVFDLAAGTCKPMLV